MKQLFALWKRETCPKCHSWKSVRGSGYAQLRCSQCKNSWEVRDSDGIADAPQARGEKTVYEDLVA